MDLAALLNSTFGFASFRPNQQAVCEAAAQGQDVLLVMPTGAGKSLCYQLPALARGGTALAISPLIALMDDQAAKLAAAGLRVARIHSGLPREAAREACRDYLSGALQFLFIAPERMRVPGFPEMLAKRRPSLIAIDEAHCISQWGHDFRPDYRTLGDHLPALRPAPIIALTATATPVVQRDIVAQLRLASPALFIHGFRRSNLAIEVVEMSKPRRSGFVIDLLKPAAARPAIVYAPSRKSAEELASQLGPTASAYHAGLDPATRDRVQTAFLTGRADVVVATIAFGMGIDKADVRTVVHLALPASVEGFYQEIGRAGRDGLPSRTVLLHSFADRRMHEFFLERDYPAAAELARVHNLLTPGLQHPEDLARRLKMDPNTLANALSKLASQGAATFDFDGQVRSTGAPEGPSQEWRSGYDAQLAFRRQQIDRMVAFAETPQCRMTALIRHFGDISDGLRPCGHCDHCAPEHTSASTSRPASAEEQRHLRTILRTLETNGRSTGKLFTDLAPGFRIKDRKAFDELLNALARAGLLTLTTDTFTSKDDGRQISYKKAALTHEGRFPDEGDLPVTLRDTPIAAPRQDRQSGNAPGRSRPSKAALKEERERNTATYTPRQQELESALRDWRKKEAGKTGKPAFMVFGDSTLQAIVLACPCTIPALMQAANFSEARADRYGAEIIAICRSQAATRTLHSQAADLSSADMIAPTTQASSRPKASQSEAAVERSPYFAHATTLAAQQPRASTQAVTDLTPSQKALDSRLRSWRAGEAERLNLPHFLVLGSSALRSIVLLLPQTIDHLKTVSHLDSEKLDQFGPAILDLCREASAKPESSVLHD